jgi:hypothetical protein
MEEIELRPGRELEPGEPLPDLAAWMATTLLLADRGYCEMQMGEDEESQWFASEVRKANPDWEPGHLPAVPLRRFRNEETKVNSAPTPVVRSTAPRSVSPRSRSRERRPGGPRRVARTSGSRGDPHQADDDPSPLASFRPSQGPTAVAQAFERAGVIA